MDNLTRREALKRGATLGGMLLWTTPAVQAIGMSRALAQETSGPCTIYCIKFEFTGDDDDATDLTGVWGNLGGDNPGNCFACPDGASNGGFPAGFFDDFEVVSGTRKSSVTIRFPDSCSLVVPDSTPDEFTNGASVAAKCGSGTGSCNFQSPVGVPGPDETTEIEVDACANGKGISHIELIIRCCT